MGDFRNPPVQRGGWKEQGTSCGCVVDVARTTFGQGNGEDGRSRKLFLDA